MKRIKIAIIGQGRSGRDIHATTISKFPEMFEIIAVTDPIEERRNRAQKELSCEVYADYRDLFYNSDIDIIVNAAPSHLHVPISLECLNSGYHVLCEKPLSRRLSDVDTLAKACEKSGKMLAVYQQLRYAPAFEQLRNIINSGVIGRVIQANIAYNGFLRRWDWQTLQENDGGNLMNNGSHPLDQALQLFGATEIPQVICMMDRTNSFGDAEDYVKIILHGDGYPTIPTYQIQGTWGGIKGSLVRLDWKYFKPKEAPDQQFISEALSKPDGTPAFCNEELIWYEESWEPTSELEKNPHESAAVKFYTLLYHALVNGEALPVSLQEVRRQIAVVEQCFDQNPRFASKITVD
jgi:scyllo-inositol 2-dehydrogenase (NADP+)